ncbi:MAG: MBL fold metallo-hydrolase [Deltaproteobacteria bacterium CG11_big_fil_rev_8_21_14_0_20_47_16]|nr:MAG: MBL fold metallo-hydrolase [Deltaproteobacteria bacterium CG11_big_fil_rev_8_21_14_0_20_47_16]
MIQIGPYQIDALETGEFALDGGAMFGVVPKPVWSRKIPVDAENRIDMRLRCLLIRNKDRVVLVDTGIGHKEDENFYTMFRVDYSRFTLEKSLAAHGLTFNDITDVILTHLHFDHAGGATQRSADGKLIPTFPNAKYYVQISNLQWAEHPTERDRASYIPHNFVPLQEAGVLTTLDGVTEIFTDIHLELCEGHTTGLQTLRITDQKTTLYYCADLVPTSVHLPLPWVMGYDLRPLVTLEEKREVLARAAKDKWILAFEHCPLMAAATIELNSKGYAVPTAVSL